MAWSSVAGKEAAPREAPAAATALSAYVPRAKSARGLHTLVVDSNAFLRGISISGLPYELCTVKEVVDELRDPGARAMLDALPVPLTLLEPSPESMAKVAEFSRATGDLCSLSSTDIKVIALAHTLEVEVHGGKHLRSQPPPLIHKVAPKVDVDPPGWGSHVPNPESWDELPEDDDEQENGAGGVESHILGLKELCLDDDGSQSDQAGVDVVVGHRKQGKDGDGSQVGGDVVVGRRKQGKAKVKPQALAKANAFQGVDASKGEIDELEEGTWEKAGCRTTRRKHKRRAASSAVSSAENAANVVPEDVEDKADKQECNDGDIQGQCEEDDQSKWMSSIACMTSDFPMQNVILQMGLRLYTPDGVQVRELQRWALKCHACGKVTPEVGRLFCPKCGNGGTLSRVSMSVGADGAVEWGSSPRINIRGTRFSLPLPKGGREGTLCNPILREDQLPRRVLHTKNKKEEEAGIDTIVSFDELLKPKKNSAAERQLRQAACLLTGRRNPNDVHYNRKH